MGILVSKKDHYSVFRKIIKHEQVYKLFINLKIFMNFSDFGMGHFEISGVLSFDLMCMLTKDLAR